MIAVSTTRDGRYYVTVLCLRFERWPGVCLHLGLAMGTS